MCGCVQDDLPWCVHSGKSIGVIPEEGVGSRGQLVGRFEREWEEIPKAVEAVKTAY